MDCVSDPPLLQVGNKKRNGSQCRARVGAQCRHYHHILEMPGVDLGSGQDACPAGSIYLQFFTWALGGDIQLLGLYKEQLS